MFGTRGSSGELAISNSEMWDGCMEILFLLILNSIINKV